jgi:hypothetical protein
MRLLHTAGEIPCRQGLGQGAHQADDFRIVRVQRAFDGDVQLAGQLHVVTHFRVQVQRQVIGQQADIVLEQGFQAALFHAGDARVFALPEITVVHQYQVSLGLDSGIQQGLAGGHATDDTHHLRATFDLQAIGAIITDGGTVEVTICFFYQRAQGDSHKRLLNIAFRAGRPSYNGAIMGRQNGSATFRTEFNV